MNFGSNLYQLSIIAFNSGAAAVKHERIVVNSAHPRLFSLVEAPEPAELALWVRMAEKVTQSETATNPFLTLYDEVLASDHFSEGKASAFESDKSLSVWPTGL